MRGEWVNAFSSLLSFTTRNRERREEVDQFQHLLLRCFSLLHGAAMRQVSTSINANFEIFDMRGVDKNMLKCLKGTADGCEVAVVLQWIQRIIVDAADNNILAIAPPILS